MLDNVYVLCKFIDTIPAAKGALSLSDCTHIKINLIKKETGEEMHRIEINVCVCARERKEYGKKGREEKRANGTQIDNRRTFTTSH